MARPWRLRHKLVLGLALVVGSIALLLGGAVFGLTSYFDAMRTTEHKLALMQIVVGLTDHVHMMSVPPDPLVGDPTVPQIKREQNQILHYLSQARLAAGDYRRIMESGRENDGPDPDEGAGEQQLLDAIDRAIRELTLAVESPGDHAVIRAQRVIDEPAVRSRYDRLTTAAKELFTLIKNHIDLAHTRAASNHRRGLTVAVTASVIAFVLVLTMMYYFRVWVFAPIKQLQTGVQRVHGGDFDHPIQLNSQDELEELANEFNAMTVRLRDIYKDLARQVNERSRQLVRSERMVSVGFLAAGVAHEINNPLASIAFCAEALERRAMSMNGAVSHDDAATLAKYLKVIQQEAFRCKQITQKLLDFSRSGERTREASDLGRLVQDVVDVARLLPNHRAKTIAFTPGYLLAAVSPPDLKSVVLNLIVNALDSMDDGGVLTLTLSATAEHAVIAFTDTGCGMTPDVLDNIFEPFFTRKRTGNGTGLGLSISHQIIDQHGGTIQAASRGPGTGSTFTVKLPLRPAEVGESSSEPATLPFPGNRAIAA